MKAKLVILLAFLGAALAVVYFNVTRGGATSENAPPKASESNPPVSLPEPSGNAKPVDISFVFSTEKKEWLDAALSEFATAHKEIKVNAVGKGSLEASDQILD